MRPLSIAQARRRAYLRPAFNNLSSQFANCGGALHGNPHMTEVIVWTGDTMRKRHYDARVTHKAEEEYFAILP